MTTLIPTDRLVDENFRNRLSSRDDTWRRMGWDYPRLCEYLQSLCPHIVTCKRDTSSVDSVLWHWNISNKRRQWCAEHSTGFWMDSNFDTGNHARILMRDQIAFQNIDDAIHFKLTWL